MIKSVSNKVTTKIWRGQFTKKFSTQLTEAAQIKLRMIHVAKDINDLRSPPGNQLEKLSGDLDGYHSIRINRQWRIIFVWQEGDAYDVDIIDYH